MLYLKCTADVQKTIGLHKSQLSPIESSEAPLGHWMVNRFMVERRKAYVFMSESTLLSFILLSGKVPMTPQRLPGMLIGGLVQLLQLRGLPTPSHEQLILTLHFSTPKMTTVQPWVV